MKLVPLGAGLLLLAAAAVGMPPAAHALSFGQVCSNAACVTVDDSVSPDAIPLGQTATVTFTVTITGGSLASAQFVSNEGPGIAAQPGTVTVNGVASNSAVVTDTSVAVDLAHGANVAPGTITVAFDVASVAEGTPAHPDYISDASVTFTAADTGSGVGPSETAQAENVLGFVGQQWNFSAEIGVDPLLARANSWVSFQAVAGGSGGDGAGLMIINLPAGLGTGVQVLALSAAAAPGTAPSHLACHGGEQGQELCDIPANRSADYQLQIFIPTDASVPVGTNANVTVIVVPSVGSEPDQSLATATVPVAFVAPSVVTYTFTPSHIDVPVGQSRDVTLTIRNVGDTSTPRLTGSIPTVPATDEENAPFDQLVTGPDIFGGAPVGYRIGSLSPGQSVSYNIRITGHTKGVTGEIDVDDYTYTPAPDCTDPSCFVKASAGLKIVDATAPAPTLVGIVDSTGRHLGADPTLSPGEHVTVIANGFAPGAVGVTLHSTPRTLAPGTADASGSVHYAFTVPADLPAGAHTLAFAQGAATLDVPFAVAGQGTTGAGSGQVLANTGTPTGELLTTAIALLVSGVVILMAGRRRVSTARHRPHRQR